MKVSLLRILLLGVTIFFFQCQAQKEDCYQIIGGEAFVDECGDCVGGTTGEIACTIDCNGKKNGEAFTDECGECVGGNTGEIACETDCAGVKEGKAYLDNCDDCVGGTTGKTSTCLKDCAGVQNGKAYLDDCNTCVGGTSGNDPCAVVDVEGQVYQVVTIGKQTWMASNLKTTKYNDGTSIEVVTSADTWESNWTNDQKKPMMSWYANNSSNTNKWKNGGLYNRYVVSTGKLCPANWHVPSEDEWKTLANTLNNSSVGKKLKSTSDWTQNGNGTNNYKFNAKPSGYQHIDGSFLFKGKEAIWWTSNAIIGPSGRIVNIDDDIGYNYRTAYTGVSVRCVYDY